MTEFGFHHGCLLPCGPTRAEIATAMFPQNHGVTTDENNPIANYLATYQDGTTVDITGVGTGLPCGPWEIDLAAAFPPEVQTQAEMGVSGVEDPQAFSGCFFNWFGRAGFRLHADGKWTNGYRNTNAYALPGLDSMCFFDSDTAHWNTDAHEYVGAAGANAWDGTGIPHASITNSTYNYKNIPSRVEYLAGPGKSKITVSGHNLQVGDAVVVNLGTKPDTSYNGEWVVTDATATTFQYVNPTAGTTITSGFSAAGAAVYGLFETQLQSRRFLEFLATVDDTESFVAYSAPRMTHIDNDATYNKAGEVRYKDTVDPAGAFYYGRVAGAVSPVGPSTANGSTSGQVSNWRAEWARRQEMLISADDQLRAECTEMFSRFGDDWYLIILTDNGDQIGEQDGRGCGDVKVSGFEGSLRSPCFIFGPGFEEGRVVDDLPTGHVDIAPTMLDIAAGYFPEVSSAVRGAHPDLVNHFAPTKRDGYSILRLLNPADPVRVHGRALPFTGQMSGSGGENGLIEATCLKRARGGVGNRDWDPQGINFSPSSTYIYEKTFVARSAGAAETALQARMDAIQRARWDPVAATNPARTV